LIKIIIKFLIVSDVNYELNKKYRTRFDFSQPSLLVLASQVNLNTATKDELLKEISGLSEKQTDAIISYRETEGTFIKAPELLHIGIGNDIIEPN
jgi:competence ComEA-like helix-hairpin-helix protein